MANWRVGVDSGGTFTDVCVLNEQDGSLVVWKTSSSPENPAKAILSGVADGMGLAREQDPAAALAYFGHGTTVATNALIQKRGARTGMLVTEGFGDVLELARQRRPHLYDLEAEKPVPLATRDLRLEVRERTRHDGRVEAELDEAQVREAARQFRENGVDAVAVCFLYSYRNPEHERRAAEILREECPGIFVTASHEIAPEFREYERFSTATVNAYLGPVMETYIHALEPRLGDVGLGSAPHITQSNGGTLSFDTAGREPVRTLLSGPATGVSGALAVMEASGIGDFITFDMGGTSSDISLIEKGEPSLARETSVHGYPLKVPMLDIHTIGAGGGSIAHVDAGGLLKVGPQSAGAVPGPACYGRGGTEPTVCDANVVLQTLNPVSMLGGRLEVDRAAASQAVAGLAGQLGLGLHETAQGIISVVTANMARAIRFVSVRKGYDPREYTLVAFGGAGPLHAARLMLELEMPRTVVPRYPGLLCAMGLLVADLKRNDSITNHLVLGAGAVGAVHETFQRLRERAEAWFEGEGIAPTQRVLRYLVDARYKGQNYELGIPVEASAGGEVDMERIAADFHAAHKRVYGYSVAEQPVELVTFRSEAVASVPKARIPAFDKADWPVEDAKLGMRDVWFPELSGFAPVPVFDRARLGHGHRIAGPAVVEQMDSTTVVLPAMQATVDANLNLILEVIR